MANHPMRIIPVDKKQPFLLVKMVRKGLVFQLDFSLASKFIHGKFFTVRIDDNLIRVSKDRWGMRKVEG
jgi:hypothetical protein